jgi:hypothetical protein
LSELQPIVEAEIAASPFDPGCIPRPGAAEEEAMLEHDTIGAVALDRRADALRKGDHARLVREARLHAATTKAAAPAHGRSSILTGWWHPGRRSTTGLAK